MSHGGVELDACPNCRAELDGAYCAACGQKVTGLNPTLHDFLHDLTHELLHVDGKIVQSVRLLLARPGFLTREYFAGRRARYVSPIRLYLIFSVAYFAMAALAPSAQGGVRVFATGGNAAEEAAEIRKLGYESEAQLQEAVNETLHVWTPRAMFVLVPVFALLVAWVTRRSGRNYPQHLYFALHVHAAAFALLVVPAAARALHAGDIAISSVQAVAIVGLAVYVVLAFREAYGMTAVQAVTRTAVVGVLYVVALGFTIAGIVIPLVLPGLVSALSS